jgi:ceramide glucosyltransferase
VTSGTLSWFLVGCVVVAVGQMVAAGWLTRRDLAAMAAWRAGGLTEPVSVLKPLHGDEALLAEALESVLAQDWPTAQFVFGVQDQDDQAIAVVEALRRRHPGADITLVVDPTPHGPNHKVSNLINMFPSAKHDVLVIADSDLHVAPDYLARIAAALREPGVGLVTALYAGLPASRTLAGLLGAMEITLGFLPAAVLSRRMGRRDCLGATMALRRETLGRIGGLAALVGHLADDNALGRRVRALGLDVALMPGVVVTTVAETSLRALFRHELRWARTIRGLEPLAHAASVLRFPLFWALLLAMVEPWGFALFFAVWLARAVDGRASERWLAGAIGGAVVPPASARWLLPAREVLSVLVWLVSHAGWRVDWRGHAMRADRPSKTG